MLPVQVWRFLKQIRKKLGIFDEGEGGKLEAVSFWVGGMSPFLVLLGLIIGAAAFWLPSPILWSSFSRLFERSTEVLLSDSFSHALLSLGGMLNNLG